ncbi:hypothetical protein, partial [Bacillus xiapuensis]|nr:hypothetical protein [Bacillus xiapuensis]
ITIIPMFIAGIILLLGIQQIFMEMNNKDGSTYINYGFLFFPFFQVSLLILVSYGLQVLFVRKGWVEYTNNLSIKNYGRPSIPFIKSSWSFFMFGSLLLILAIYLALISAVMPSDYPYKWSIAIHLYPFILSLIYFYISIRIRKQNKSKSTASYSKTHV